VPLCRLASEGHPDCGRCTALGAEVGRSARGSSWVAVTFCPELVTLLWQWPVGAEFESEERKVAETRDANLVGLTRGGDRDAYGALVTRYQGHVYGLAYSLVGKWTDAQDVAQETFIRAYFNLGQLREPGRFAAWLRRVTFGVAMNWLRTHRPGAFEQLEGRVDLDVLEIPDFRPGPSEVVEKRELADAVMRAVETLPAKYRVPLTMFHLDGLSYQKVADFLDIPLGSTKALIWRARQKLRSLLPEYLAEGVPPVVQEVLDEHKLPAEFSRKVLENIPRLAWEKGEYTLAGAVVACMEFLKEEVSYDFLAGVSGGAFELRWHPGWGAEEGYRPAPGEEPIRRIFQALGRRYQYLPRADRPGEREAFLRGIVASVQDGKPVIAGGVVGPQACVVAGYEEDGAVLLGHSYFHDGSNGYYRKSDWYDECWGLILIGGECRPSPKRETLRDALQWAVELARTPKRGGCTAGLAAYDAWAAALRRDGDFPADDLPLLTRRCNISNSIVLAGVWDARRAAAGFLKSMVAVAGDAGRHVLEAARAYGDEYRILDRAMHVAPFCHLPEETRLRMADPTVRGQLADFILEAKEKDEQALSLLEGALKEVESG